MRTQCAVSPPLHCAQRKSPPLCEVHTDRGRASPAAARLVPCRLLVAGLEDPVLSGAERALDGQFFIPRHWPRAARERYFDHSDDQHARPLPPVDGRLREQAAEGSAEEAGVDRLQWTESLQQSPQEFPTLPCAQSSKPYAERSNP